jgi:hypothetical protein
VAGKGDAASDAGIDAAPNDGSITDADHPRPDASDGGSIDQDAAPTDAVDFCLVDGGSGISDAPPCTNGVNRYHDMIGAPINPPNGIAAFDLAPACYREQPVILSSVEAIDCAGTPIGDALHDGNDVVAWGPDRAVWLEYNRTSSVAIGFVVLSGYLGTLEFSTTDGLHHYRARPGELISKDNVQFLLHWTQSGTLAREATELFNALRATFTPTIAASADCVADHACRVHLFSNAAVIEMRSLHLKVWTSTPTAPQPISSLVDRIDLYAPGQGRF